MTGGHPGSGTEPSRVGVRTSPADGIPAVVDEWPGLHRATRTLAAGTGPVAIDAERAHAFRYSQRAYLIQLRRRGCGTILIDPVLLAQRAGPTEARSEQARGAQSRGPAQSTAPADRHGAYHPRSTDDPADLGELAAAIEDAEWIIHAANQDLACLAEIKLWPQRLFDTELAARLLGYPRVNLGTLLEENFSVRLLKEHAAADWSKRPLPQQWLSYAALDVELLIELRDTLAERLEAAGKADWARQEFAWLASGADLAGQPRRDPWRRTSGLHRVHSRRGLGIVAELWHARDRIAYEADLAPARVLPDSGLIEAATLADANRQALGRLPAFGRRPARRHLDSWATAVAAVLQRPEAELPTVHRATDDPPQQIRAWSGKDPQAAARLQRIRSGLTDHAAELGLPPANLLTPAYLRQLVWRPPARISESAIDDQLAGLGARPWQRAQTVALVTRLWDEPNSS